MKDSLSHRQKTILEIIQEKQEVAISDVIKIVEKTDESASKATIHRDLDELIRVDLIEKIGQGKATRYILSTGASFLLPIEVDEYMVSGVRTNIIKFNDNIFSDLEKNDLFTDKEKKVLETLNDKYHQKIKTLQEGILKRELERLTIELSWKSSVIEGNTYELLETETLLKEGIKAKDKPEEDAVMLLNHKYALDMIGQNLDNYKEISLQDIENLHEILIKDLNVAKGLRKSPVGITGTSYEPLSSQFKIREALDKACEIINHRENLFEKAFLALIMIAYIQPFVDGNKRTSRILPNAILLANDAFPLSFRSIDVTEYKKAVIVFYEINNVNYLKQIFIEQCQFSVEEYFHV